MTLSLSMPLSDYVATDLHGHSRFSDGTAEPEELVAARAGRGVRVLALSDHDVLAGVEAAARAAARAGVLLIPAMEATSFVGFGTPEAEQFHVLCYFPPRMLRECSLFHTALYRRGLRVQAAFRAFILGWLDELHAEDRAALDPDGSLAREPAERFPGLQRLIDRVVARRPQVFKHFIRSHVRFWQDDRELFGWSPEDLIDCIRADGGVDIVAHPARYRDKERLSRVLLGASGVEVYTSRHRPEWSARFRAFAEQHGKLWTASTDDHQKQPYQPPPCGTPLRTVERLIDEPLAAAYRGGAAAWPADADPATPPSATRP
jgi:hypothetical protein